MTKSNKTLLCCLLTCVMVLAFALTILPIAEPTTANAAETTYVKVTEAPDDWTGTYLVVYESGNNGYVWTGEDIANCYQKVDLIKSETTSKFVLGATAKIELTSLNSGYSIKIVGGAKDGKYIYGKKDKNVIQYGDAIANTIELSNGEVKITSDTSVFRFNSAADNMRFRYFKSSSYSQQQPISLYKIDKGHTHTWGEWTHVNGTEKHTRTCTADATHTETENCTFNESNTCTVCGYTKVICDHTELTLVPEVAATCTTTGVKEHYKCANVACGKLFDKNTDDKQEVTLASLTIAALDHSYGEWEVETEATCTAEGKKARICERCADVEEASIPALGHNYGADGKCTLCGAEKPVGPDYTILPTDFDGSKYSSGPITISSGLTINATDAMMRESAIQLKANSGSILIKNIAATKVRISIKLNGISVFSTDADGNKLGDAIVGNDGVYLVTNAEAEGLLIRAGSSYAQLNKIEIYGTVHTHEWSEWKHVEGTETHERVCLTNENHKETGNCNFVNDICTVCGYDKSPKQFTVTETVTAVENGSILNNGTMYILPNGQIDVVYNVTANSGINALEGTIAWNAELFDFVSMTAGNIFGENNVTVSGESATTKKIAVTIGASNNATGVLLTVRYQLKDGVTAEQLANAKFGFTADVLFGTDTTTKVANTATENAVPMSVRQDATLTVNGVDYTADDRTITLTYNGQNITAGTEDGSVLKIATNHTGYNADCLTWTVVKNAGNYVLKIAVAADGAYNAISEVSYTIVVKQVEIATTDITLTNNTTSKDLLGGNAKWTEADFTITYNGETLPDEFSGLYQIAIVNGEVAEATAEHTLTVELTLTEQASVNYVLTGTDVAEGKLSKQFVVSVVNAAINIIGMPDNVERAYNAQAIDLSVASVEEGATLKIYVALNGGAEVEVTENLDTYVKNVGNYVVRFEAHKNANVYSQTRTYTITKCDLAKVELDYNGDTFTWTDTQTNGETVVVKYTIAATEITNNAYTATQKNTEEVKLVVSTDNANYNGYQLTLANVYSVTFSYLATHDAETNTAIVKYVFDGQHAASIELPTETGYTFSGWYLLDNETVAENVFDFATTEIKNDITLTGKWTVNTYTVTFKLGNGQDDVTVSVNYGEKIADKIPADPTKAADDYIYTFKYWTLSTDETKAEVNVAEYVVSGDVTFVAEYDQTKNEFTVTLVIKYNDETITTETRVGKLGQTIELPSGIQSKVLKLGKWLYEDETEFDGKITKTATVTATYEIILEKGDVNGDGKVNLDDVVLFRKYLVGGYAIDEIADEDIYTAITAADAASKTMFFKYSANMDNDANLDIRDVATIRMNVVVTTEGGEEQTQTTQSAARMEVVSEAVQYAVLPTNKFVA